MSGWLFKCPECGADVSSGWGDPICPIPRCGARMIVVLSPPATEDDIQRMLDQVEDILRGEDDGNV